jgi:hypothetical protein
VKKIAAVGSDSRGIDLYDPRYQLNDLLIRSFRILITGSDSGLVETITDAVSIHSIKKVEYAKRIAEGRFGHITLFDHFLSVCLYDLRFIFED